VEGVTPTDMLKKLGVRLKKKIVTPDKHTHNHLTALFLGLPG